MDLTYGIKQHNEDEAYAYSQIYLPLLNICILLVLLHRTLKNHYDSLLADIDWIFQAASQNNMSQIMKTTIENSPAKIQHIAAETAFLFLPLSKLHTAKYVPDTAIIKPTNGANSEAIRDIHPVKNASRAVAFLSVCWLATDVCDSQLTGRFASGTALL